MFGALFWFLKKSSRLKGIARRPTSTPDGGESLVRTFAERGFVAITPRLDEIEEGMREFFTLIRQRWREWRHISNCELLCGMGLMSNGGREALCQGRGGYSMKGLTIMSCQEAMKGFLSR